MSHRARFALERAASRRPPRSGLRIVVVTDTHIDARVDRNPAANGAINPVGNLHLYGGAAKLRKAVDYVNVTKPHLLLHLGDMTHQGGGNADDDLALFNTEWARVDASIPKALVPGNHDLYRSSYANLVDKLAATGNPEIAGSKFNRAFTVTGDGVSARIVMADFDVTHGGSYTGSMANDLKSWLSSEIASAVQDWVLICSHYGPHMFWAPSPPTTQFNPTDATALAGIVNASSKRILSWFGHTHATRTLARYQNLGKFPGYLFPALVEAAASPYVEVTLTKDGRMSNALRWASY